MWDFLEVKLGEFTLGWFLLSVVGGGILGAAIKYLFEVYLPQSLKRRQRVEAQVRKYSYPLLQAASDVELRIQTLLDKGIKSDWLKSSVIQDLERGKGFLEDPCKGLGYFFLSTVYVFARYFAWVEILRREAGFLDFPQGKKSTDFYGIIHRINNAFRYTGLARSSDGGPKVKDCTALYRHVQSAIGEMMIVERNKELTCVSFREFVEKYTDAQNNQFRFWLRNLMNYFDDLSDVDVAKMEQILAGGDHRVLRLMAIQYWYFKLVQFLDPKFQKVQHRDEHHDQNILKLLPDTHRAAVINLPVD